MDFLAHSDPITSLPNRRAFNKMLNIALSAADETKGEVGLILLDLDNFKIVNDTMGHQCGDEILRMVAHRLSSTSRSTDTVCRIGGDEFVIIMTQRDQAVTDLEGTSKRILTILAQPFRYQVNDFFLTASIGSSLYPQDAQDSQTLIRKADTAMYSAKLEGKNTFAYFRPEMDQLAQRRLLLERQLRKALELNEMSLNFQPQVNFLDGKTVGVEALLRWNHPTMGMITPTEFIPVAEDSGLIVDIGKWVLRTACLQVADWREAGLPPVLVAVNLSARQVKDHALINDINRALADARLVPSMLELEITEGVLMDNVQSNIDLLHTIQKLGINLSIDDFGTGYSSLSYLKRFPVNQLKIDRSFLHDVPGDGEAFVTAIIAMAHNLGLSVVAEGVETVAQLQFLRDAGCDIGQGYYFARPAPADQIAQWLAGDSTTKLQ